MTFNGLQTMTFKNNLLIAVALFTATSAMADDFSVGAGAVFNESPYMGHNENVSAVPLISYEGEHFYVRQTTAGWIVWKDGKNELSLTASWMPLHYDPDDNDDRAMSQLDERKSSAMLGGAYYRHESCAGGGCDGRERRRDGRAVLLPSDPHGAPDPDAVGGRILP